MKKNIHYILGLLAMAVVLTACEGREPDLFDEDSNGAYFDYEYATDFEHTLNLQFINVHTVNCNAGFRCASYRCCRTR